MERFPKPQSPKPVREKTRTRANGGAKALGFTI